MKNSFQNFFQKLIRHGLEYFGLFYGSYRGTVVDNKDPEMLGRIRISCSAIYGDDVPSYWAWPKVGFAGNQIGFFAIPQIGDGIYIECECGNPKYPIWSGGWWAKPGAESEVPETARLSPPTNRVWQTTSGHRIELDDTSGVEKIKITDKSGNFILIDSTTRNEEHLVGNNKLENIGSDKEENIGDNKTSNIGSNKNENIGDNKTVTIGSNKEENIGNNKTVNVGSDKEETIGGKKTSAVTTDKQETIGGNWTISVAGNASITAENISIVSGNGRADWSGGKALFDISEFEITNGAVKLASQGTLYKLVVETFLDLFNSHNHGGIEPGGGNTGAPNQQAGAAHKTSNTEAS